MEHRQHDSKGKMTKAWGPRWIDALVGVPLLFLVTWAGGWVLVAAVSVFAILSLYELYLAFRSHGLELAKEVAFPCCLALVVGVKLFSNRDLLLLFEAVAFVTVIGSFTFCIVIRGMSRCVDSISVTTFSVLYIGWLFTFFVLLRDLRIVNEAGSSVLRDDTGCVLLFHVYFVTGAFNSVADNVSYRWGRIRLCPTPDNRRTLEGMIAGTTAACIVSLACGLAFGIDTTHAVFLGFLLAIGGQLGNLVQSLMKHDLQVRDFGAIFTGYGGVLDRFDSLLINVPLAYFYTVAVISIQ